MCCVCVLCVGGWVGVCVCVGAWYCMCICTVRYDLGAWMSELSLKC